MTRQDESATRQDLVSVVVPVRNGEQHIAACLRSLQECRRPAGLEAEILVVDDGSTDSTAEIVAEFSGVRLLRQEHAGPSAARNLGIAESRGEAVLFTDDDCEVDPAWMVELVTTLRTSDAAAAGGTQRAHQDDRGLAGVVSNFLLAVGFFGGYTKLGEAVREVKHNASCNSAYRREALTGVGGFAVGLWPGEDVELDLRIRQAGGRILYNPRARVCHRRPGSWASFTRMMARYGCWSGGYLTRHYGLYRPLSLAPLFFAALLALLLWEPLLGMGVTAVLTGLLVLLFRRAKVPTRELPTLLALGAVGAVAWNLAYLRGLLIGRQLRPGLATVDSPSA